MGLNNERRAETIHVLAQVVSMEPISAVLLMDRDVVRESFSGCNGAICLREKETLMLETFFQIVTLPKPIIYKPEHLNGAIKQKSELRDIHTIE